MSMTERVFMKNVGFVLLLLALVVASAPAFAANSIIIDYTCTDMSQIPQEYIDSARNQFNIILFRTSHGSQITTGVYSLGVQPPSIREVSDDLGHLGDTSFVQTTREWLGSPSNPNFNVVWWAWCGGVADNTEEGINAYLQAMEGLEAEYPTVTFIYATGPLWHPGDIGTKENSDARNQQIRNWIASRDNKIFFDLI